MKDRWTRGGILQLQVPICNGASGPPPSRAVVQTTRVQGRMQCVAHGWVKYLARLLAQVLPAHSSTSQDSRCQPPPPQSGGVFSCSLSPGGAGPSSCSKFCIEYLLPPPWVSVSFRGAPISTASLGSQGNICFKKEPAGNPAPEESGPDRLSAEEHWKHSKAVCK